MNETICANDQWWERFAIAEVPHDVMSGALALVRNLSDQEIHDIRDYEQHPAVVALCSWWNAGPGRDLSPAAYFETYQRVGTTEKRPYLRGAADLAGFIATTKGARGTAFVAPNIFLVFCTTQHTSALRDDGSLAIPLVDNSGYATAAHGAEFDESLDDAYYCIYSLKKIALNEPIG